MVRATGLPPKRSPIHEAGRELVRLASLADRGLGSEEGFTAEGAESREEEDGVGEFAGGTGGGVLDGGPSPAIGFWTNPPLTLPRRSRGRVEFL